MAERRVDVARLNDMARACLAETGMLSSDRVVAADTDYATGDVVMFTANDYHRIDVRNGERGTITALDTTTGTLTVTINHHPRNRGRGGDGGREVVVPRSYLDDGHLVHGYAATVHKNQGATADRSYLLASDALYRELGYVAMSRGRSTNRIWTVDTNPDRNDDVDIEHAHTPIETTPRDPIAELVRSMERSAAQQLAIDEANHLDQPATPGPNDVDVDALIDRRDQISRHLYRNAPLRVDDELADAERRYQLAETRLHTAGNDEWSARAESFDEARRQLDEYAAMQARFDNWAIDHTSHLAERRRLDHQIRTTLTEMTIAIEDNPPQHIVDQLGHQPTGVDARNQWRAAVVDLAIANHDPSERPHVEPEHDVAEIELS